MDYIWAQDSKGYYYIKNQPVEILDGAITFVGLDFENNSDLFCDIEHELKHIIGRHDGANFYFTLLSGFEKFCENVVDKLQTKYRHIRKAISVPLFVKDVPTEYVDINRIDTSDMPYAYSEWYKRAMANVDESKYIIVHLDGNEEVRRVYQYALIKGKEVIKV
jgi:uncharacterized phage-like protein YoqJ